MTFSYRGAGILFAVKTPQTWEVLLGLRRYSPFRGYWSVPGGGMSAEDGGSFLACAFREAAEELCIGAEMWPVPVEVLAGCLEQCNSVRHTLRVPFFRFDTFLVKLNCKPDPWVWPRHNHEFEEVAWFPVTDLPTWTHLGVRLSVRSFFM